MFSQNLSNVLLNSLANVLQHFGFWLLASWTGMRLPPSEVEINGKKQPGLRDPEYLARGVPKLEPKQAKRVLKRIQKSPILFWRENGTTSYWALAVSVFVARAMRRRVFLHSLFTSSFVIIVFTIKFHISHEILICQPTLVPFGRGTSRHTSH